MGEMNWIQRKIFLYNVTFGLYMLDWWERCTFNTLLIVLMWFVLRYVTEFFRSILRVLYILASNLAPVSVAEFASKCGFFVCVEAEHVDGHLGSVWLVGRDRKYRDTETVEIET